MDLWWSRVCGGKYGFGDRGPGVHGTRQTTGGTGTIPDTLLSELREEYRRERRILSPSTGIVVDPKRRGESTWV